MGGITGIAVLAPGSPFCCDAQLNQYDGLYYQNTVIVLQRMVSVHKVEAHSNLL